VGRNGERVDEKTRRGEKMKLEDAIKLQERLFKKRMEIRRKKGHDYANLEDCLINFKTVATIAHLFGVDVTKPYGVAFFYKILKLQREANLLFSNKTPENESLLDTLLDLSNYNDLELECLVESGIIEVENEE